MTHDTQRLPVMIASAFFLALAIFLRLYQLDTQLIADDEWHAVFRTADLTAWQAFTSFGASDHSIPMVLYDKAISKLTPLNEFWLRLPSVLAGFVFLLMLPLYVLKQTANRWVALCLLALLASSPLLVLFSRLARPYMLGLLLAYLAHIAFHRYWAMPTWRNVLGYAIPAMLSTWLLPLLGFFVIASFFFILPELFHLRRTDKNAFFVTFNKALRLGVVFTLLTTMVLLPPLYFGLDDLRVKAGQDLPTRATWLNVWFIWFGSKSSALVVGLLLLAGIGARQAWCSLIMVRSAILGCVLILLSIYLSKPAWVMHHLTFARYLLPALPVIFICIAFGLTIVCKWIAAWGKIGVIVGVCLLVISNSTLPEQRDSGHTLMGYYLFEPRVTENPVRQMQEQRTYSPFWTQTNFRPDAKIALAPFYFVSYDWNGVMTEALSKRRVLPAFINGFCLPIAQIGEPDFQQFQANRIRLDNALYLAQFSSRDALQADGKVDWFVWQQPSTRPAMAYMNIGKCDQPIRDFFGTPDYEDEFIQAFKLYDK